MTDPDGMSRCSIRGRDCLAWCALAVATSDEDKAAIDESARAILDLEGDTIPALYVGGWDPERGAYVAAYGDAEIGKRPADVGDSLRIGSITKTITATVVWAASMSGNALISEELAADRLETSNIEDGLD